MNVKSADAISKKWQARAAAAAPDYTTGVQSTQTSWAEATANASDNWAQGVQQAVADKRFQTGVQATGDAGWRAGAVNKGSQRYAQGVNGAAPKFQQGFEKFRQALAAFPLPKKFPKGDPQNNLRSTAVQTLLRNVKLGKA